MNIGQQVVINSKKFAYKCYEGRVGVVVGVDEVQNSYFVWCNWATLTIPADELAHLSEEPPASAPKFSLPEVEVEANSVESAPAPRKRGRPAKVHTSPNESFVVHDYIAEEKTTVPETKNNFENEYHAEYIAEETKKYPEPDNNLPEQESLEPHGD